MKTVLITAFVLPAAVACGQMLDPSFGTGGMTTFDAGGQEAPTSAALMDDGRIVVAGWTNTALFLLRYTLNGQLDPSFGVNGVVMPTEGSGITTKAWDVVVLADGRIIVAGSISSSGLIHFLVRRYLSNGDLDMSFGSSGQWVSSWSDIEEPRGIVLQSDGKILLCGRTTLSGQRGCVVRLDVDGTLDTSFGSSGMFQFPIASPISFAWSMALQTDGKVLVTGDSNWGDDAWCLRLTTDGVLDGPFGTAGLITITDANNYDSGFRLLSRADGTFFWMVWRSNTMSNGEVDLYHVDNDGGYLPYGPSIGAPLATGNEAYSMHLDAADRLLVFGDELIGTSNSLFLARNAATGDPDASFGTNGALQDLGSIVGAYCREMMVRPDGDVVLLADRHDGPTTDVLLMQYTGIPAGIPTNAAEALVSVTDLSDASFLIHSSGPPIDHIRVCDGLGRAVLEQEGDGDEMMIDLHDLPSGWYFASLMIAGGRIDRKMLRP
ncbi:MAG: hypothetical protein H6597_04655 [Flavobacteriales bacterium]|nr:hypothetical protein [Flavobacteriales bacterium]MCB9193804.1 hypothetical protein [Flavobacteriales bacterium]